MAAEEFNICSKMSELVQQTKAEDDTELILTLAFCFSLFGLAFHVLYSLKANAPKKYWRI